MTRARDSRFAALALALTIALTVALTVALATLACAKPVDPVTGKRICVDCKEGEGCVSTVTLGGAAPSAGENGGLGTSSSSPMHQPTPVCMPLPRECEGEASCECLVGPPPSPSSCEKREGAYYVVERAP